MSLKRNIEIIKGLPAWKQAMLMVLVLGILKTFFEHAF